MRTPGRRTRLLAYIGVAVCLIALTGAFIVTNLRLSSDQHATCLIQQRGLKANRALTASVLDINRLLNVHPPKGTKVRVTPPAELALVANLRYETGLYARIQAQQPAHRKC